MNQIHKDSYASAPVEMPGDVLLKTLNNKAKFDSIQKFDKMVIIQNINCLSNNDPSQALYLAQFVKYIIKKDNSFYPLFFHTMK